MDNRAVGIVVAASVAMGAVSAYAERVDLSTILGNSGFEDDARHGQWTATKKSPVYVVGAPVVNPTIIPKGETESLQAPVGARFVGVLNSGDANVNGRLVHQPVPGQFPAGTVFEITVFASHGRLPKAKDATFADPSEVTLQLFGWAGGCGATVKVATDDWSIRPSWVDRRSFSSWSANDEWSSQTFQFVSSQELRCIALAMTGKNHQRASYVAFDVLPQP